MPRIYTSEIISKEDKEIILAGWVDARRDHGKLIFLDLRDKEGIVQLVITPKQVKAYEVAKDIRDEWVVRIKGKVQKRPSNMINSKIETGDFEISVQEIEILNKAEVLPFPIHTEGYDISEDLRLKYRYLDLRRPRMREMLKLKEKYKFEIAKFLQDRGFTHVDTPILTKATPEGAQDFLVPSRNYPGKFYALPQSPQQYKQLLMVAGLEKYFQFARCFRDEDLRQDRLLEFEQLDIELSFVDEEDVIALTEELAIFVSEEVIGKKIHKKPFPRLTYEEVMKKYGTDKPDLRENKKDADILSYCWITDFPMFEKKDDGTISTTHHPFTAIKKNDINKLTDPDKLLEIKARQYDLVLNGSEVFGGSIREHNPQVLAKVFEVLGHSKKEVEEKFGHILESFSYGVPPHGGIAASDRWFMVMTNEKSIREVVAFPTSGSGRTAVMDAPARIASEQLRELKIKIINNGKRRKN